MYSVATLTEDEALQIAEAYFKGEKDPPKMALILGIDQFDLNVLMHPLVRRQIIRIQKSMDVAYSLKDHVEQLKTIRDAAFNDDNYRIALLSETQIGKAVGLYDPKLPGDDDGSENIDPLKLSTQELRRRIAKSVGAVIPNPEPATLTSSYEDDDDDLDEAEQI